MNEQMEGNHRKRRKVLKSINWTAPNRLPAALARKVSKQWPRQNRALMGREFAGMWRRSRWVKASCSSWRRDEREGRNCRRKVGDGHCVGFYDGIFISKRHIPMFLEELQQRGVFHRCCPRGGQLRIQDPVKPGSMGSRTWTRYAAFPGTGGKAGWWGTQGH